MLSPLGFPPEEEGPWSFAWVASLSARSLLALPLCGVGGLTAVCRRVREEGFCLSLIRQMLSANLQGESRARLGNGWRRQVMGKKAASKQRQKKRVYRWGNPRDF